MMRNLTQILTISLLGVMLIAPMVKSDDAGEIMKKSHMAYYYAGDDGVAERR